MTENHEIQKEEKSQLKVTLLRRIFYLILIMMIYPLLLFPFIRMQEGTSDMSNEFYMALGAATLGGVAVFAMVLFGLGPVVIKLLEIRKQEKEEKEDMGMRP